MRELRRADPILQGMENARLRALAERVALLRDAGVLERFRGADGKLSPEGLRVAVAPRVEGLSAGIAVGSEARSRENAVLRKTALLRGVR